MKNHFSTAMRVYALTRQSISPKLYLVALLFALPAFAFATAKTWTGTTSTAWGTPGNWSPSGVPGSADAVTINSGGNQPAISTETVTITSLTISSGATLTITGGSITVSGGTITVSGAIAQSGGTFLSTINLALSSGASLNMSSTGLMHLASTTGATPTNSLSVAANATVTQSGGTIETLDITTTSGAPAGTYTQSGGTLSIYRDYKSGGTFNATAGTVQFLGTASAPTFSTGTNQFFNVIVGTSGSPKFDIAASSAISIRGDFTNNNTTLSNTANSTITFNGTIDQNIYSAVSGATTTFGTLVINKASGNAIFTSNAAIAGNLTVTSGTLDLRTYTANRSAAGGTFSVAASGTVKLGANTGGQTGSNFPLNFSTVTLTAGCTVEYNGSNAITQTIYATPAYSNLTLTNGSGSGSASKITTASITVNSILNVQSGAVLTPAAANTVGGTGTLSGFGTAQVTRTAATPDFLSQYTISNKSITDLTVDYSATAAQTISAVNYGYLTISGARTTTSVTLASSGTIGISGHFTSTATFTTGAYVVTGSTVSFNGIINQNVPAFTFNNLTVAKSVGEAVLTGNITVNGTLTFSGGKITTGNYAVAAGTATITGASQATGWVNGTLQRQFASGTLSRVFDVGGTNYYSPVTLTFASVTGTGAIGVYTTEANHPNIVAPGFTASKNLTRYFRVTNPGAITFTNYNISLNWNSSENYTGYSTSLVKVGKYAASAWTLPTVSGTPTTTNIVASSITTIADFVVGELCDVNAGFSYTGTPYCSNSGNATITLNSGSTAGTFTASPSGLSLNSTSGLVTLGTSTAGSYTVTNTATGSGGCSVASTAPITISQAPSATISYAGSPYCAGAGTATVTLTGTTGGTFSSTAGLSINATTGDITLGTSTLGTYTVTYTVAAANGCSQYSTTTSVNIYATPAASISYTGTPYCTSVGTATVTRTGSTGGTYSSSAGLSISATTGDINTTTSTAGTYTVYATVSSGCSAQVSTSVVIEAAPSATISYSGSPYCNVAGTATVTQTGSTGGTYSGTTGLVITAANGNINTQTSTAATHTVTYTIAATTACPQYQTTCNLIIKPLGVWTGAVSSSWNNTLNWDCNVIPTSTTNVVIPSSIFTYPVISSVVQVNNVTLQSGGSITVINGNLKIKGTATTTGGKINSNNGKVEFNGTTAQTIPADFFVSNATKDLTISNAAGVTLGGALKVTGSISFGNVNNCTFNSNGYLTLGSNSNLTASVNDVTNNGFNSGNSISGVVTIERFIGSRRAFRFLTAPVNCTDDVRENWMEGVNNPDIVTWLNPYPGYGTHITGPYSSANGFDATNTNNPSLFMFNNATQTWSYATWIHGVTLKAGSPYRIMIRGDRSTDLNTNTPPPSVTTLRAHGTLLTGTVTLTKPGGGGTANMPELSATPGNYSFVANPYACAINWLSLDKTDISNTIYIWDPTIAGSNNRGAYVAYNGTLNTNNNIGSLINNHIQSGQAFFVQTTGSNPVLTIKEQHKSGIYRPVFRGTAQTTIGVHLLLPSQMPTGAAADGVRVFFSPNYSNAIGDEDSYKFGNLDENIGIVSNNNVLSLEGRKPVSGNDTIRLKLWQLTAPSYAFKIDMSNFDPSIEAYLEDAYTNRSTRIVNNDTTIETFDITPDSASFAANRFRIVFKRSMTLPVHFTTVKAFAKNRRVEVEWVSQSEMNLESYEVEKSADAQHFVKLCSVQAKNSAVSSYTVFDEKPFACDNYYRIKSIDRSGQSNNSNVVKVTLTGSTTGIEVYPNPVQGTTFSIGFNNLKEGQYEITLTNTAGTKVYSSTIKHSGGTAEKPEKLSKAISAGIYQLQVTGDSGTYATSVIVK